MGDKKNCNLCDLCKSQEETYHHLFYECDKVVPFWTSSSLSTFTESPQCQDECLAFTHSDGLSQSAKITLVRIIRMGHLQTV